MALSITITVDGLPDVQRAVDNLASKIANPDDKLMTRVGLAVIEDTERRFMTAGYGTWPPLSAATVKRKKGSFILIDTGAMFASLRITKQGPQMVDVTVPYGGRKHNPKVPMYHQTGTKRIPQRKIMDKTPQLLKLVDEAVSQWIDDMLKAFKVGWK